MPCAFQASSILRYSVILFWRFFAAARLSGLMFSSPMKTRVTPARFAFSMKFGILWHSVSTWIIRPSGMPSCSRSSIRRSKIASQSLVAGEIVVGDEELADALRPVQAHEMLDVVGRAEARLASLHVDDGAERALIRAAAAGVEAGAQAERARDVSLGQERRRRSFDLRQVLHEVVERRQPAGGGIAQHRFEPALGLAGEDGDAHLAAGVEIDRVAVEHRQATRHVEAADQRQGCRRRGTAARCRGRADIGSTARRRERRIRNCRGAGSGRASAGTSMRVFVSSIASISMATSGPSTCRVAQSTAMP